MPGSIARVVRRGSALFAALLPLAAGCAAAQGPPPASSEAPVSSTSKHTNRLAQEKSPYLLQHARNPVDWYPWGDEAFEKARREDKPVFLSIGYATCHWCHVMERESFEDEAVAAVLNEHFVAIKVDREERPDIDDIYMGAVQALSGSGGWPLTAFLTADGKPFFGGTYFPNPSKYGRPSFMDLLRHIREVWTGDREKVTKSAAAIAAHLAEGEQSKRAEGPLDLSTLHAAFEQLRSRHDRAHGGWGTGTKFPTPHVLSFLLAYHARTKNPTAKDMALSSLAVMCERGLRDHLAGGFHRYCVDREWTIPHFEKMLYDQALLVRALVEAWQLTGDGRWADVARETLDFVLRDMTSADGAFTSAWDADSEGVEGKFYVWTEAELKAALGADFALFAARFGVTAGGNFHELPGANHLLLATSIDEAAKKAGVPVAGARETLEACKQKLLARRASRVQPLHDDKVLTDWNGLMIGAFAYAGRALGEPRFVEAALRARGVIRAKLQPGSGLLHRLRGGEAAIPALLDDHAFLAWADVELYAATWDPTWLASARDLTRAMVEGFWDAKGGGLFQAPADTKLIHRSKPSYDGAVPAGGSVAALVLLELGRLLQDDDLWAKGQEVLNAKGELLSQAGGHGATQALLALDLVVGPVREVVIAGAADDAGVIAMRDLLRKRFLPRTLVVHRPVDGSAIAKLVPFVAEQGPKGGKATAYVCEGYACQAPVHDVAALGKALDR
jgi:uncharacterized protein YyaL (SSP411 family)